MKIISEQFSFYVGVRNYKTRYLSVSLCYTNNNTSQAFMFSKGFSQNHLLQHETNNDRLLSEKI